MAHFKSNDLQNFQFTYSGYGHYKVIYYNRKRGDYWVAIIDDMTLIDATLNAEVAKAKDINLLYNAVKRKGTHYKANGERIN